MAEVASSADTLNPRHYETQVLPCPECGVQQGVIGAPFTKTFENWRDFPEMRAAFVACRELLDGARWCVFLRGITGCGKTHLAVATAQRWSETHGRALFANVPALLDELRNCYARSVPVQPVLNRVIGAAFLVLDDYGAERATDFAVESLYKVVDRRSQQRAPTIVTSNWTADDELDARVVSRLSPGEVQIRARDRRREFER